MCDNGNLDKFLGLVRSWTLQENLLLLLYQTSVISNCILSTYPLSKKLYLQQMETILESYYWSKYKEQIIVGYPMSIDKSSQPPIPKIQKTLQ